MLDGVVQAGAGVATQRIGLGTRLRVVDAILTGVHERGTSHYELLRAFADDLTLLAADEELAAHGYRHARIRGLGACDPWRGLTPQGPVVRFHQRFRECIEAVLDRVRSRTATMKVEYGALCRTRLNS